MLKDKEKRGRTMLASIGLTNLMQSGASPMTRNDIFAINGASLTVAEGKEVALAATGSKWQTAFLGRMIQQGLLTDGGKAKGGKANLYICNKPNAMHVILKDSNEYGLKLPKLLFPGEVIDPTDLGAAEASEDEAEDDAEDDPDPEASAVYEGHPDEEVRESAPVDSGFMGEIISILEGQREAMDATTEHLQSLVNDQASIKKRQSALEKQLVNMTGLLNSIARRTKDGPAEVDISQGVRDAFEAQTLVLAERFKEGIAPLSLAVDTTKTASIKTHGKLDETLRLFKQANKDQMGKALRDLTAVAEMIGDSLMEDSDGNG